MARQVNQVLWDQWRQRIERQRASGLSIAEFCRRENISRQGFHVWKRKLRQNDISSAVDRREPSGCNAPGSDVPSSRHADGLAARRPGPRRRPPRRASCNCRSRRCGPVLGSSWRWPMAPWFACPSRISRR